MKRKLSNPFSSARLEYEQAMTLYILSGPGGYADWITSQQFRFEGVRGSGKSSILRSMEYDIAWRISKIRIEAEESIKNLVYQQPHHLAVRFRLETMDTRLWNAWKDSVGELNAQKYFSAYIDYYLMDLFLSALIKIMQKHDKYFKDALAERNIVDDILQIAFPVDLQKLILPEYTFWVLRKLFREKHNLLRAHVYNNLPIDQFETKFTALSPGNLIQSFGESLTSNYKELSDLLIFPMLDDCNHLADWQTKVINSAVLKAQTPISYKITSVIGLYPSSVTMDDRPLNEQEIKTYRISGELSNQKEMNYDKRFEQLAQGVCLSRIAPFVDKESVNTFNLKRILGDFKLQDLLYTSLGKLEKTDAFMLIQESKKMAGIKGKDFSITSTWLLQKKLRKRLTKVASSTEEEKLLERQWYSIYTKKFSYGAAFAICKQLHIDFPYCGYNMVHHLSGGSIRDFLKIMHDIYAVSSMTVEQFVRTQGLVRIKQTQGIKEAAKNYLNSLDKHSFFPCNNVQVINSNGYDPTSLYSICLRLGRLFDQFQSDPYMKINPEIAAIRIKKDGLRSEILEAIRYGVLSGAFYVEYESTTIAIGLNPIMAPYFNNSFHKPLYYPQSVTRSQFYALFNRNEKIVRKAITAILTDRLNSFEKTGRKKMKRAQGSEQMTEQMTEQMRLFESE